MSLKEIKNKAQHLIGANKLIKSKGNIVATLKL